MGGGKMCSVVGCRSNTREKERHFYRFPKEQQLRNVWMQFTRRGDDFVVKYHVICEFHFDPSCFLRKKKQVRLKEGTAPTIFERITKDGKEKVVMDFDKDLVAYINSENLLDPVYDKEKHGNVLAKEQRKKMEEVKKLCRFCLEDKTQDDENLIAISKLEDYFIKLGEAFAIVGLNRKFDDIFGDEMCEECFQHVITFDGFRKRCRKAQNAVVTDLKELDQKIQSIRQTTTQYSRHFEDIVTKTEPQEPTWENEIENFQQNDDSVEFDNVGSTVKIESENFMVSSSFHKVNIKQEAKDEPMSENECESFQFPSVDMNDDDSSDLPILTPRPEQELEKAKTPDESDDDFNWKVPEEVPEVATILTNEPKAPVSKIGSRFSLLVTEESDSLGEGGKQYYANRIYECWFCRLKFAGKKTFKKHACTVTQMKCPVERCEKYFKVMSGYNQHIIHLHKLPKLSRLFCKICKLSMVATDQEYKSHLRKCEINSNNLASTHSIKCEVCLKVCPNIQSYSIHKLFHKPDAPKKKWSDRKDKKGMFICETCGKEFEYQRYLRHHITRLHSIPKANLIFTCDHCGKTRNNRATLSKHIRNVHRSEPTPCGICGKVFRNKSLMQAHMIYHKDSKRIHFCPMCPDKPPYVTAVALRRHQESNHGYGPGYRCEICNGNFRTKASLKQHTSTNHRTPAHTLLINW